MFIEIYIESTYDMGAYSYVNNKNLFRVREEKGLVRDASHGNRDNNIFLLIILVCDIRYCVFQY